MGNSTNGLVTQTIYKIMKIKKTKQHETIKHETLIKHKNNKHKITTITPV